MELKHLDLDISDKSFEFSNFDGEGEVIDMPIQERYPKPETQFDIFSNSEGGGNKIDPNLIAGAVGSIAGAIGAIADKTPEQEELKARCGNKPLFGKAKKEAYRECANEFYNELNQYSGGNQYPQQQPQYNYPPPVGKSKKGMSTGAIVGISLAGIAILGTVIYLTRRGK